MSFYIGIINRSKAEACAIRDALEWAVHNSNCRNVTILSDSKSVLIAISSKKKFFNSELIRDILLYCYNLSISGTKVHFVWIKGHAGIAGNETCDALAKSAVQDSEIVKLCKNPDDFGNYYKNMMKANWQNNYQVYRNNTSNPYALIHPILPKTTPVYKNANRNFYRLIFRLKTGHAIYPAHQYKIGLRENPFCECSSDNQIADLNHIFFNCNKYNQQQLFLRNSLITDHCIYPPYSLPSILSLNDEDILKLLFKYLSDANITI